MKTLITLFMLTLSLLACTKSQSLKVTPVNAKGKIIAGIGCTTWLIQLDNNTIIQPTNLLSFNIIIQSGQQVSLTYQKSNSQLSTCESGEVVDLLSITN